ncbi:MAG: hypothetical protein DRR16_22845 [Candidatus Parabeggiatoa sp. nov. 3]|nr:MAG: hypothetical protein DRR00_26210 [Gammaproteobacteria bacterium]RKZ60340.1 MAG: hypothetical protein DRQ99_22230 [Gammaproteobacteria bacterium]RKZ81020.1 MAG: hypothetical protein DRR16_22845 [Gammaproteobacteria bacterium]HEW97377.1 hypothetical protein [Beggiatoa sp.]
MKNTLIRGKGRQNIAFQGLLLLVMLVFLPGIPATAETASQQSCLPNFPLGCVEFTQTDSMLKFQGAKADYRVGEKLEIDVVKSLDEISNPEMQVDLWVVVKRPNGVNWFVTGAFNPLSETPQFFLKELDGTEKTQDDHRVLTFEKIPEGVGGDYLLYAVYVAEGTNPMEDFTVIRSNIAKAETTLAVRKDPNLYPDDEDASKEVEEQFQLDFEGMDKSLYSVGDHLQIDLKGYVTAASRRVDLWVTIILPSGDRLFLTDDPFNKFGGPQAFVTELSRSDAKHRVLDFVITPGYGGTYSFFAVYVEKGKNPMKDFTVIRSNVARQQILFKNN